MKKLIVSCDEYVYSYKGKYYFRKFGVILTSRYLSVFEALRLVVRVKVVSKEEELGIFNIPITDDRIEIYPIPFFQGPKQYAYKYFKIKKTIKKSIDGCDVAIFRIPSTIGFAVLNIAKKRNIPYAVEVVFNPLDAALNTKNIMIKTLMRIIHIQQVYACKHADGASYVTKFNLQKFYPATKIGHFESHYSSVELPQSFYGIPRSLKKEKTFIICHVSNPIKSYHKGHITVIDTIKILKGKGYNVIAHFAGDGNFVPFFENYAKNIGIEDNIKFMGLLNRQELHEFFLNSDLMLFPSKSEGLPRVLIEAMATGLPCLSTPIAGIPELISDELMFNPYDCDGFASKISEIIDNPLVYNKLSKLALEKSKDYEVEVLQARRFEFYQKLKNIS